MFREFVVGKQATDYAHDRDTKLAWTIAALERQKQLPKLATLLAKREVKQNPRQMRTTLQLISEVYKIPLRKKTKKRSHG